MIENLKDIIDGTYKNLGASLTGAYDQSHKISMFLRFI